MRIASRSAANAAAAAETAPRWNDLPDELWTEVLKRLPDTGLFAFASSCTQFRRVQVASERKFKEDKSRHPSPLIWRLTFWGEISEDWCVWMHSELLRWGDEKGASVVAQAAARRGYLPALQDLRAKTESKIV